MNVIPDRRRIRPVAGHRPHRVLAAQRALAPNKRGIFRCSLAAISVTVCFGQFFFATGRVQPVQTVASMLAWRSDYDKFVEIRAQGAGTQLFRSCLLSENICGAVGLIAFHGAVGSRGDGVAADADRNSKIVVLDGIRWAQLHVGG
jgi:hypothetical protein